MSALHDLQKRFYDAVTGAKYHPATASFGAGIEVYRNNLREGFRKALAADYPVIERLVGGACFAGLAREYVRRFPSTSGDLQDFGHEFARFLDERYASTAFPYLADVARLERAVADCLIAGTAPPVGIDALGAIDAAAYDGLRLRVQPACRLFGSAYPVLAIWRANQITAAADDVIELAQGAQQGLVRRTDGEVFVQPLARAEFIFIHALRGESALGTALTLALACDAGFDAAASLWQLFDWKLVAGIQRDH